MILYLQILALIINTLTLEGEITAPNGTMAFLSYEHNGKIVRDSAKITNNRFRLSKRLPETVVCTLQTSLNQQMRIFLAENRSMKIEGDATQLYACLVREGLEEKLYQTFSKRSQEINKQYRTLLKERGETLRDRTSSSYVLWKGRKDSLIMAFVSSNPSRVASAIAILDNYVTNPDRSMAGKTWKLLSPGIQNSLYGLKIRKFVDAEKNIAPGMKAPDFTLPDSSGKMFRLSDFRGKYVLIDFWASWCPPCRKEHPLMVEYHQQFKTDSIIFLSISMDSSKASWKNAVVTDTLEWLQLNDPQSLQGELADTYGIKSLPFNCIIDPEGTIIKTNLRGESLGDALNKISAIQRQP